MAGTRILMLEDESERVERFRVVLAAIAPDLELVVWDTAPGMIREVLNELPRARLISLDHDLFTESEEDPGDGLEVAQFLAERAPCCPVIIHTSNSPRAVYMIGALELEGWNVARVVPWGERWIEEDWRHVVADILFGDSPTLPTIM